MTTKPGVVTADFAPVGAPRTRQARAVAVPAGATPVAGEYRRVFPVGAYLQPGPVNYRNRDNTPNTTQATLSDQTGLSWAMDHREQGVRERRIPWLLYGFSTPAVMEDAQHFSDALDGDARIGVVETILAPTGRTGASSNTGINYEWFQTAGTSDPTDYGTARSIAQPIVANYQDHPSNIGYYLKDDVSASQNQPTATLTMCRAMQNADPFGRPCLFTHVNPDQGNLWAQAGADLRVALTYRYPCGRYANGSDTAEGDFHRSTFAGIGGGDWIDALRQWIAYVPAGIPLWLFLQAHQTTGAGAGILRLPTVRELRAQFWQAIGEGAKGLFWFTYDTAAGQWVGFADASRIDAYGVIAELSSRLRPDIRARLLAADKVADAFTATGGGSSGYPINYAGAYVSTLKDRTTGASYCVACNHGTSPATVTLASGTLAGTLVNLEDGSAVALGGAVTLPALDGSIWRLTAA